jgi:hypothetical protein
MLWLQDLWKIDRPPDYKLHFARWDGHAQPLEVWARDKDEWHEWQEYRPARDEFNRPLIFALAQFYHETDIWLFGGIFRVLARHQKRYDVEQTDIGRGFSGRLKLRSPYRGRTTRVKLENHYSNFEVAEILREPYSGRSFPGYDEIDLSFDELETLVRNDRADWKAALQNIKGVYLITDTLTGSRYIGSAYAEEGVWSRWCSYIRTGHGGNAELRSLVDDPSLAYCRANFRFALLEQRSSRISDEVVLSREAFWKRVLRTRGEGGLNRN